MQTQKSPARRAERPILWIVAGPNGSGKSTLYDQTDIEDFGKSVWIINPDAECAEVCHAPEKRQLVGTGGYLDGEHLLPGFRYPIAVGIFMLKGRNKCLTVKILARPADFYKIGGPGCLASLVFNFCFNF